MGVVVFGDCSCCDTPPPGCLACPDVLPSFASVTFSGAAGSGLGCCSMPGMCSALNGTWILPRQCCTRVSPPNDWWDLWFFIKGSPLPNCATLSPFTTFTALSGCTARACSFTSCGCCCAPFGYVGPPLPCAAIVSIGVIVQIRRPGPAPFRAYLRVDVVQGPTGGGAPFGCGQNMYLLPDGSGGYTNFRDLGTDVGPNCGDCEWTLAGPVFNLAVPSVQCCVPPCINWNATVSL